MGSRALAVLAVLALFAAGCRKGKDDRTPTQLSLGATGSCAVMKDQSIRCWGMIPGADASSVPVRAPGRWIFRQVATGAGHACAKVGDDEHPPFRVICWGANGAGQVGEAPSPSEPQHPIELDALDVAAGGDSSCARLRGGSVSCWGALARSKAPAPVKLASVAQVVLGKAHACARLDDGTVWCWGDNARGQLGDGTTVARPTPARVAGLAGVTRLAAGDEHTCARVGEEKLLCWGKNAQGQLGDGTTIDRLAPVQAHKIFGAVQPALGGDTSCARMQDASVMCWGDNHAHQLTDGTTNPRTEPALVFGVFDVVEVAVGRAHMCTRFKDSRVRCWGGNASGQVGDGTARERPVPVDVKFPPSP